MRRILLVIFLMIFVTGCMVQKNTNLKNKKPITRAEIKNICSEKTPKECNDIGVKFEIDEDFARANLCYQKACENNEGVACSNLGSLYQKLKVKSESEILAIFMKSCELKSKFGCYNAANFYRLGRGTEYDFGIARKLYEVSCIELKHAQSCSNLGGMYQFALGLKMVDMKSAKKFYQMGCKLGDNIGCRNLSLIIGE